MLNRSVLAFIFILGIKSGNFSQSTRAKNKFTIRACFGGINADSITKYEHLEDSLSFTDSLANDMFRIASFRLALACNGNVIHYFENKSGNKLTAEMKDAIRELHPGCTITFMGIVALDKQKDIHGKNSQINPGNVKLILKN
jgi:hypothetical protein